MTVKTLLNASVLFVNIASVLLAGVPSGFSPIRLAAGSSTSYTDIAGQIWAPDYGFAVGSCSYSSSWTALGNSNQAPLYKTGRQSCTAGSIQYNFPVPNGSYNVTLKFAESTFTPSNPGQRVFNINVNNVTQTGVNIASLAGGAFTPYDIPFTINVTSGAIAIALTPVQAPAIVNAIEIVARPPISQADVIGLTNSLALYIIKGPTFRANAVLYTDSNGLADGVLGSTGCVYANGNVSPCPVTFVFNEKPSGVLDGNNATFTLVNVPVSLALYRNGILQQPTGDYTITGNSVSFVSAPAPDDTLQAIYFY